MFIDDRDRVYGNAAHQIGRKVIPEIVAMMDPSVEMAPYP